MWHKRSFAWSASGKIKHPFCASQKTENDGLIQNQIFNRNLAVRITAFRRETRFKNENRS